MLNKIQSLFLNKKYDLISLYLFLFFAVAYFFASFLSNGYYQHDEVGHLINARRFWNDPFCIFTAWAKPGLKFILILPSLFGNTAILIICCFITAGIGLLTNKLVHLLEVGNRYIAQIISSTLVLTVQLSFRAYSETFAAFFIILTVYLYYKERYLLAAFFSSYLYLIRPESAIISMVLGVLFLTKRKYIPFLLLGWSPIFYALMLWIKTGDPLFIFQEVANNSENIKFRQVGFFHYWKFFPAIAGTIPAILLFIGYFQLSYNKKEIIPNLKKLHLPYLWFTIIFVFYCLSVSEWFPWLNQLANSRALVILTPFIGLFGAFGLANFKNLQLSNKIIIGGVLAIYTYITHEYLSFKYNDIVFTDPDPARYQAAILLLLLFLIPLFKKNKAVIFSWAVVALMVVDNIRAIEPYKLSDEDKTMKKVVSWYHRNNLTDRTTLANHALFFHFSDEYPNNNVIQTDSLGQYPQLLMRFLKKAKPGSIIIWDSHYNDREIYKMDVKLSYLLDRPHQYRMLSTFISPSDQYKFKVVNFEKVANEDPDYEKALSLYNEKKFQESGNLFLKVYTNQPQNYGAITYRGLCLLNLNTVDAAYNLLSTAISLNPDYETALFSRGQLLLQYGKVEEASKDLTKVVSLNNKNIQALFYLGNIELSLKKYSSAIYYYAEVLKLNNKIPDAYFNVANSQLGLGQAANACANFQKAVELGHAAAAEQIKIHCK